MFKLLSRSTNAIVVLAGILVFWLTTRQWVVQSDSWQRAEGALIDQRYLWRGHQPADTNIVLIGIETSSFTLDTLSTEEIAASPALQDMKQPWAWSRAVYAATVKKLMDAGAKVIVFDLVFPAPGPGDDEFAEMLKKYRGHIVVAAMFEGGDRVAKGTARTIIPPNDELLAAATDDGVGLASAFPDSDDVVRRGIYRTSLERENPDLGKFANQYNDNLVALSARAVQDFQGTVHTPPYGHDNFIDYQGPGGTYRPIPIETLFVDKLWKAPPLDGGLAVSNKIVVVGPIANILHDVHFTPFGEMPGPELQIQMIATLLHRSSLTESSAKFDMALTICMIVIAVMICIFVHNAALKPFLLAITIVGFVLVCRYSFSHAGEVVTMMPPLFGLAGTGAFGLTLQYILEQFERRRYRSMLDRYVSKGVANLILDDKRSFEESLRGRKQSLTVLFSDIRGFTSLTEGRDADQLVSQLNEYFLEMVGAVLDENGSLQKFIGDAIMAAWGDVHSDGPEEDTRQAVRAALKMRANLAKLNEAWQTQPNRVPLHFGIGINEGEMVVGNIGHPQRMEFTVMGDGVNLAARLESATKQFHTDFLVGETVESLTRKHFVFRCVGLLTFKGKSKPVETFTVLSDNSQPPPPWLARYHNAIQLFRDRKFGAALKTFHEILAELKGEDFLCKMYIEQCGNFLNNPPPEDWTGTLVLTEK